MIINTARSLITIYYRFVLFFKAQIARLAGGRIIVGKNTNIHPSVFLSTGGGEINLGDDTVVLRGAIIAAYGGKIDIGNNVSINPNCVLYGHGGLKIGNDVRIATGTVIVPAEHVFQDKKIPIYKQGISIKGIEIEDDVWLAAGVRILDGARVSKGCVVGAGGVLKGKTEPYGVYVGNPAKKIKERR